MKPRNKRAHRVGGILVEPPPPPQPTIRDEPHARRVTVEGRVYAAWDASTIFDWLADEPPSV